MTRARLTSKGQVTIPKEIRDTLQLQPGDHLEFIKAADGRVYLMPCNVDVRELSGILYREGRRTVTLEEMEDAIAAGASDSAGLAS